MLTYDGFDTTIVCDEFAALFVDDFSRTWDDVSCHVTSAQLEDIRGWELLAPSVFDFPTPIEDGSYVITSLSDNGFCSSPSSLCPSTPASNSREDNTSGYFDAFAVDGCALSSTGEYQKCIFDDSNLT